MPSINFSISYMLQWVIELPASFQPQQWPANTLQLSKPNKVEKIVSAPKDVWDRFFFFTYM